MSTLNKKTIIGILVSLVITLSVNELFSMNGQYTNKQGSSKNTSDSCILISFTAKQIAQKNFINWCVSSDLKDYYFVLEKSTDGKNFSTVNIQEGAISPRKKTLQFFFIDNLDTAPTILYRISAYKFYMADDQTLNIYLSQKNIFDNYNNITNVLHYKDILTPQISFSKN